MKPITPYGCRGQWSVWRSALMGVIALSLLSFKPAQGQPQRAYSEASLRGQYAIVGTGGNHTAASLGIEVYDGQGNVTRSLILNERDADDTRKVIRITGRGSYRVQPDGMGNATIVNTLPDGSTFTSHLDFVITQATTTNTRGEKIATEVFAILRETGIAAPLVTFVLTRLPD